MDLSRIEEALDEPLYDQLGRVSKVVGLTIESIGPEAKLNDLCKIQTAFGSVVMAEVVGFNDKRLILMPFESTEGIAVGSIVTNT
ncbi:MAG: flagellum-specific ATP synthase FliI, partial [Candidatus Weimeria sp.]